MYLQSSLCLKKITEFMMHLICQYLIWSFLCCSVTAGTEIICCVCIIIMCIHFICLGLHDSICSATRAPGCFYCLWIEHPAFMRVTYHMLSSVCLAVQCLASSLVVLHCFLVLQKTLISYFYLCILILLYTHPISLYLTCVFLIWLNHFCGMQCS